MALDFLGEAPAALRVEDAVAELLRSRAIPSLDARSGISTSQMGDMVVAQLRSGA